MIDLILSDVDGCLSGKIYDLEALGRIRKYCEKVRGESRPPFIFSTGRGAEYVDCLVRVLNAYTDKNIPSIIENGSFLYYPTGRAIIPHPMMAEKSEVITSTRSALKEIISAGKGRFVPGKEGCVSVIPVENISMDEFEKIVRVCLSGEILAKLSVTHSTTAVDITIAGISKGSALEFLSREIGINIGNILAIGDAKGDLEILGQVGFPACPGNSSEEVKSLVKEKNGYVAREKFTWGVVEIMEHYELLKEE